MKGSIQRLVDVEHCWTEVEHYREWIEWIGLDWVAPLRSGFEPLGLHQLEECQSMTLSLADVWYLTYWAHWVVGIIH